MEYTCNLHSYNKNNTEISCNAGGFINGMGVFEMSSPALLLSWYGGLD